MAAQPDLILLPDELFDFGKDHLASLNQLLVDTPAVKHQNIHLFDGSLLTWHGTRLAFALQMIPGILSSIKS